MPERRDPDGAHEPTAPMGHGWANEAGWFKAAMLASFAGLIFSIIMSLTISLLSELGVPFVKAVEIAGIDASTEARARLIGPSSSSHFYIFFDVDEAACVMFATLEKCRTQNPMTPKLVASMVDASKRVHAAVTVVDRSPFEPVERESFNESMRTIGDKDEESWVIAPIYGRLRPGVRSYWGSQALDLASADGEGNIKMATFGPFDQAEMADARVRRFPAFSEVFDASGGDAGYRLVPSAPYLAYLKLSAQDSDPLTRACNFRFIEKAYLTAEHDQGSDKGCVARRSAFKAVLLKPGRAAASRYFNIDYSMMSLWAATARPQNSSGDEEAISAREQNRAQFRQFDRIVASKAWNATTKQFDLPPQSAGAVIVLGSSLEGAGDVHLTPAGVMTGSEIMLNAIRTLVEGRLLSSGDDASDEGIITGIFEKVIHLLPAFVIMTIAWISIYYLASRRWAWRGARAATTIAIGTIFIGGLVLSLAVEFYTLSPAWVENSLPKRPIDVLTPVIALGLEGYADAAKLLLHKIEAGLQHIYAAGLQTWRRLGLVLSGNKV